MGYYQFFAFIVSYILLFLSGLGLSFAFAKLLRLELDHRAASLLFLVTLGVLIPSFYQFGFSVDLMIWPIILMMLALVGAGVRILWLNSSYSIRKIFFWCCPILLFGISFLMTPEGNLGYWNPDGFNYSWMAKATGVMSHQEVLALEKLDNPDTQSLPKLCGPFQTKLESLNQASDLVKSHVDLCKDKSLGFLSGMPSIYAHFRNGMNVIHAVYAKLVNLDPLYAHQPLLALFGGVIFFGLSFLAGSMMWPPLIGISTIAVTLPFALQWQSHCMSLVGFMLIVVSKKIADAYLRLFTIGISFSFFTYVFPEIIPFALVFLAPSLFTKNFWPLNLRRAGLILMSVVALTIPTLKSSLGSVMNHVEKTRGVISDFSSNETSYKSRSGQGVFDFMNSKWSTLALAGAIHPAPKDVLDKKIPFSIPYVCLVYGLFIALIATNLGRLDNSNKSLVYGAMTVVGFCSVGILASVLALHDQYIAYKFALIGNFALMILVVLLLSTPTNILNRVFSSLCLLVWLTPTAMATISFVEPYEGTYNLSPFVQKLDIRGFIIKIQNLSGKVIVSSDHTALVIFASYILSDPLQNKVEAYYPAFNGLLRTTNSFAAGNYQSWECMDFTDYSQIIVNIFTPNLSNDDKMKILSPGIKKDWPVYDLSLLDRQSDWPQIVDTIAPPKRFFASTYASCEKKNP